MKLSEFELEIALYVIILTVILFNAWKRRKRNYPPGPYGVPIFGFLPFMTKTPHLKFIKLSKKYGDIFSISLGNKPVIILNNADHIREAYSKPEFLGRPPYSAFSLFKKQSPFFSSSVDIWQEQRKFVVHALKDLGLGKSTIEGHIKDEIVSFIEILKSYDGKPINFLTPLNPSITSNIYALIVGCRFSLNDPTWKYIEKNTQIMVKFMEQTKLFVIYPWCGRIPWFNRPYLKATSAFNKVKNFFWEKIEEHKKTLDPSNIRDYVDSYLIQMKSTKEKNSNTSFNDEILLDSTTDLFGAGSETIRTSLMWCVYILAAYSDVQKRIRKEIQDVIGQERMAEFLDFKSLPYTHAFILEMHRWISVLPLNLFHYTVADTKIGGYDIPRNTAVIGNFWAVHHDPKHWLDPLTFNPERFLGADGVTIVKSVNYMPFSLGKRGCPGEVMAYMEIFLYVVSIVQHFDVAFPDGYQPTFESALNLTQRPKEYLVQFIHRN